VTGEAAALAVPARPTTVVNLRGRRGDPGIADVIYVGRPMFTTGGCLTWC
jgi:hypothetical protein